MLAALDGGGRTIPILKPLKYRYMDLGEMLTLGGSDAPVNSLRGLVRFDGATASIFRRLVYNVLMLTAGQTVRASVYERPRSLVNKKEIDNKSPIFRGFYSSIN